LLLLIITSTAIHTSQIQDPKELANARAAKNESKIRSKNDVREYQGFRIADVSITTALCLFSD